MENADFSNGTLETLRKSLADLGSSSPNTKAYAKIISDHGESLIPDLITLLAEDGLSATTAFGGGWMPVHVVSILKQLKPEIAIKPMLDVLCKCRYYDVLYSDLIIALKSFGAPVLEIALASYVGNKKEDTRGAIAEILAGIGVKDDRILLLLLEQLKAGDPAAFSHLAEYGDSSVLPTLSSLLDNLTIKENSEVIELAVAIEVLGGTLSPSQAKLLHRAKAARRKFPGRSEFQSTLDRLPRPGVNIRL